MQREKSFRLCVGLTRERSGFNMSLGGGGGEACERDTAATIPRLVEDLTASLKDIEQREYEPTGSSGEQELLEWGLAEQQRIGAEVERVCRLMARVKNVIFPPELAEGGGAVAGPGSSGDAGAVTRITLLVERLLAHDAFPQLLLHFTDLLFETRKAVASVFVYLLRPGDLEALGFKAYLGKHHQVLEQLVSCYDHETSALPAGIMLRELVRQSPELHFALLVGAEGGLSEPFKQLHGHLSNAQFDIASDAFDTFQTLLLTNKQTVKSAISPDSEAPGAKARFEDFIALFNDLITAENYVLKRNSLKLLSEFILDREYFSIMMAYVSDERNLKVIMNALRVAAPNIQFEAFHVFKVFVANPQKTPTIAAILTTNKAKLIAFLQSFQNDKDDEQLKEEKAVLIESLSGLEEGAPQPAGPASGGGGAAAEEGRG